MRKSSCAVYLLTFAAGLAAVPHLCAGDVLTIDGRPGAGKGPTEITTQIYMIDVDDIDGAAQNFTANMFVSLRWKDPRLSSKTDKVRIMRLGDIWDPSVFVVNKQRLWKSLPDDVTVKPDGTVIARQRFTGLLSQPMNLTNFPMDVHDFTFRIAAADYDDDDVVFVPDEKYPGGLNTELSVADWKIESWDVTGGTWEVVPGETIPVADYTFRARRYVGYYVWKVILPLVLIVMMSWMVFWIDPTYAGSQIGVATTSMLTLIAYRFLLGDLLPRLSYMTRMDWFILSNTILVFLALLEVIVTGSLAKTGRRTLARRFDIVSRFIFPSLFVFIVAWSFYI